ncbi:vWA domain-containing protein [Bacteroides sp.]
MKTRIFNLIILDESGSMEAIKEQAIMGMNETVQTIRSAQNRHEDQEHIVSLVTFNSDAVKTIYDKANASKVEELTDEQYTPNCCTPLYDAMGTALNSLRQSVADDDKVLVTIITDGYENASREYDAKAIKALVDTLKQKGWVFTYIGANQDVEKVAATIAITNVLNFQTTHSGTKAMFCRERKSRNNWFDKIADGIMNPNDNFFEDK